MSTFRSEIYEQPAAAERLLATAGPSLASAAAAFRRQRPAGLLIAARGSSDHAATYAKYVFEIRNGLPVTFAAPSAFTMYRRPPALRRFGVLAISQSGSSEDVIEVVAEARRQGAPTAVITNDPASALAVEAEHVLDLGAGVERSVPASKTYTTSLLMLAMLSQALCPEPEFQAALTCVPEAIERALGLEAGLEGAAEVLLGPRLAVLGRGFNLATAQEVALKVMETCAVVAESRSVADFMHGPIAMIDTGFPALLVEADGPTLPDMWALGKRLVQRGARVVALTDRAQGHNSLEAVVRLRTGLPEELTPLPFAVAGQLLAMRMAELLGIDPSRPPGLRKVTVTR